MEPNFFIGNRHALVASERADAYLLAGNLSVQRSGDASYAFEQESNFWYVTGINEPGWRVVIERDKTTLISPDVDAVHRLFDGSLSDEDALTISGADRVVTRVVAEKIITSLKDANVKVATLCEDPRKDQYDFTLNLGPVAFKEEICALFQQVEDCRKDIAVLRAIKQPCEIIAIKKAIKLTEESFRIVADRVEEYDFEYEVEADFTHYFRAHGATGHAYDPIVASGERACTLHYSKNAAKLSEGVFLLLDVGARIGGYAADITRTYAVGKVSPRHKAVHAAVEKAHHAIISLLEPGLSVGDYFQATDDIMKDALRGLNLLGEPSDFRKYFPHAISHGLGIDVHDSLGGPDVFRVGMVLTVEPGIYIPEEGIGVRIEDDILITETGHENLSAQLSTSL